MVRHKSRMGGGHRFDFFMSLSPTNDMYCFTGKKQSVAKGCYYSISLDQEESKRSKGNKETDSFIGKVPNPNPNPNPNPTPNSLIGKVQSDRKSLVRVRVRHPTLTHLPLTLTPTLPSP